MSDVFGQILDDVRGAIGGGALDKSYLGGIVTAGLSAGISANQMLTGLKNAGMGVQRQSFLALVANQRAQVADNILSSYSNLDSPPTAQYIVERSEGKAGTYRTQILVTTRESLGAGEYSIEEQVFSVGSDVPLSPAQAMQAIQEQWAGNSDKYPTTQLWGMSYQGTIRNTGRQ